MSLLLCVATAVVVGCCCGCVRVLLLRLLRDVVRCCWVLRVADGAVCCLRVCVRGVVVC